MSEKSAKVARRQIRKAIGEGAAVLVTAHEEGLKSHGEMMRHVILGPLWKRVIWFTCGFEFLYWLVTPKETHGQDAEG